MQNNIRDEQRPDRLNTAVKFLETFRSGFPDTEHLQLFDKCLVEYQAALITLLVSEELREMPEADRRPDDHGAGKKRDDKPTHIQRVIADAQTYEQHQQALAAYLEVRQRLKKALRHLLDLSAQQSV